MRQLSLLCRWDVPCHSGQLSLERIAQKAEENNTVPSLLFADGPPHAWKGGPADATPVAAVS